MGMLYGKQSSFETMVRAYSGDLFRFAYWLCRDRMRAEDLVQETFERAWKAWDSLRDENAVKSWLYTILRHQQASRYVRKRLELADCELEDLPDTVETNLGEVLDTRQALHALPEGLRTPLLLQVLCGMSAREIGEVMALSDGAVMTRLTRARQAMRRLLDGSNAIWKTR